MNRFQLLASASLMTFIVGDGGAQATSPDFAGAVITAIPSIQAVLGEAVPRSIAVGNEIFRNEAITTGPNGFLHILFRDESNMTLGPNANLVIDEFVFDPETGKGSVILQQTVGIMRFVGGAISKSGDVRINTTVGTIGIRGGVVLVNALENGGVQIFFVFGDEVSFDSVNGDSLVLQDVGFSFSVDETGAIAEPVEINTDELGATMKSLESPDSTAVRVSVPDAVLTNLQDRLEQQTIDPETGLAEDIGEVEPVTVEELDSLLGLDVLEEQAIQEVFDDQSDANLIAGS